MGVVGRAHNRTLWTFTFRACAPRPGETTAERDRETTGSNGIGKIKEPNQTTAAAHQGPLHSPIVTQRMWTLDFVGAAAISLPCLKWTVNAVLDSRKQSFTKVTHPHSHNPAGEPLPVSFLNLSVIGN